MQTDREGDTAANVAGHDGTTVYLDLDTALLESRWAPRGDELHLRPGIAEGLGRLREIADHLVVLVEPRPSAASRKPDLRLEVLDEALGADGDGLLFASCPHLGTPDADTCPCAKPGTGLIDFARERYGLDITIGWHISGDQLGVQAGRSAGLRTIRVGPVGEDHLSAVHRPDHDARDLLTAANVVMLESLSPA